MDEALFARPLEEGLDVRTRTQRIVLPGEEERVARAVAVRQDRVDPGERRLHEAEPAVAAGASRQPGHAVDVLQPRDHLVVDRVLRRAADMDEDTRLGPGNPPHEPLEQARSMMSADEIGDLHVKSRRWVCQGRKVNECPRRSRGRGYDGQGRLR